MKEPRVGVPFERSAAPSGKTEHEDMQPLSTGDVLPMDYGTPWSWKKKLIVTTASVAGFIVLTAVALIAVRLTSEKEPGSVAVAAITAPASPAPSGPLPAVQKTVVPSPAPAAAPADDGCVEEEETDLPIEGRVNRLEAWAAKCVAVKSTKMIAVLKSHQARIASLERSITGSKYFGLGLAGASIIFLIYRRKRKRE